MFDFRESKTISITDCRRIKDDSTAFIYEDKNTSKKYVLKYYELRDKEDEIFLINEFKKLVLLSAEPEIANVFGLVNVMDGKSIHLGYIMDYIEGLNLDEYLRSNSLTYELYIDIIYQISTGLEKSHHFEIFHNDIRPENIMLDVFLNIKIIDFLWNDFTKPNEEKFQNDLMSFKKIENRLFERLAKEDTERASIIHNLCKSTNRLKGIGKLIVKLDELTLDISLLNKKGIDIIAKIISTIPSSFRLKQILRISNIIIPDFLNLDISDEEIEYAKKNKDGVGIKYSDSRIGRIRQNINNYLTGVFFQLNQTHLCDFNIALNNTGEEFYGPYLLTIEIELYIKMLKWNALNKDVNFMPEMSKLGFDEILFKNENEA